MCTGHRWLSTRPDTFLIERVLATSSACYRLCGAAKRMRWFSGRTRNSLHAVRGLEIPAWRRVVIVSEQLDQSNLPRRRFASGCRFQTRIGLIVKVRSPKSSPPGRLLPC